jgi:GNAT superfamily N-acetyltransferase
MTTTVTTTYLAISDLTAIVAAKPPPPETVLHHAELPSPEVGRFFYTAVGGDWFWRDRLEWTWGAWFEHLDRSGRELWYATLRGTPAGYFELDATSPPDVEVTTLGLLPAFIGKGIGGWLLEQSLRRGLALGPRVWLHTCTLDHPGALANYRARGLVPFRVESHQTDLSGEPPGPWPGASRPTGSLV